MQFIIPIASITQCNIDMASLKLLALVAVVIAAVAADKAPEYTAPTYSAPTYNYKQPAYDYKPAEGRVKIQVYRGPTKDYEKGYDGGFAPWGFYVTQPEDNKGYGY